jgi:two-component SAPR family response regulator
MNNIKNIKLVSVAMEKQKWVPFALLSSYKKFRTAVNNIHALRYSRTVR